MAKVCSVCGKAPTFGNNRSHSMRATPRRFNPNVQKVRILKGVDPGPRLRLHPLPQGREGPEGLLAPAPLRRGPSWAASSPSSSGSGAGVGIEA